MDTWILLRGLSRESRHWGDFGECFAQTLENCRVVTIDLPGNGPLRDLTSPCRVEEMAEYCRTELARRAVIPPYNLLAMSLGAMVAVAWSHAHRHEIGRCVLINTSLKPFSPFHQRLRPRNYLPLLRLALFGGSAEKWETEIFRRTSRLRSDDAASIVRNWVASRNAYPPSKANVWRQLYAAARYRAPAEKPAAAVLILAAQTDELVDTRCSLTLARAWGCPVAVHDRAGHDLPLDDAEWVAMQVRRWVIAHGSHSACGGFGENNSN